MSPLNTLLKVNLGFSISVFSGFRLLEGPFWQYLKRHHRTVKFREGYKNIKDRLSQNLASNKQELN